MKLNFWPNIADLFSVLMMVFLFISVSYMVKVESDNEIIRKKTESAKETVDLLYEYKQVLYDDLELEFSEDFERWNVELGDDLIIKFNEPDILFEVGSDKINKKFKDILDSFWPRYVNIVEKHSEKIKSVHIEGHTSSTWSKGCGGDCSYFKNMELSQKRTLSTLRYCYFISDKKDFMRSKVISTGKSFSKMIYIEGKPSQELSRRVEFAIELTSDEIIGKIYENLK